MNGIKHTWEEGACVLIPLLPQGTIFQHFNRDQEKDALLISVEANTVVPWAWTGAQDLSSGKLPEFEREMQR